MINIYAVLKEFLEWGSGFNLEAERDYSKKGDPLVYHLNCYGLYSQHKEYIGKDLEKVLKKAISDYKKTKHWYCRYANKVEKSKRRANKRTATR